MKKGFTLIELLVASLLMGMLISILTMVFNSSSIAWRTGKAGLADMDTLRHRVSFWQRTADNVLPRVNSANEGELGLVVGAFCFERETGKGKDGLRKRALLASSCGKDKTTVAEQSRFSKADNKFSMLKSTSDSSRYGWYSLSGGDLKNATSANGKSFVVGVRSLGPDGKPDTADDVTTWPENMQ